MGLSLSLSLPLYQLTSPIYSDLGYFLHHCHCHLLSCSGQKKKKYGGFSWSNCKTLPFHLPDCPMVPVNHVWDQFPGLIKDRKLSISSWRNFYSWLECKSLILALQLPFKSSYSYILILLAREHAVMLPIQWDSWELGEQIRREEGGDGWLQIRESSLRSSQFTSDRLQTSNLQPPTGSKEERAGLSWFHLTSIQPHKSNLQPHLE